MTATAPTTEQVVEVKHPLVQHKLSYLRDKNTPTVHFRKLVNEVTLLLTYEATKDLPTEDVEVETPLELGRFPRISGKKVAVCPILRAGVGMLDGVPDLPAVAWGALTAATLVILLAPAVGGLARLLGVVDRPEGRRLTRS